MATNYLKSALRSGSGAGGRPRPQAGGFGGGTRAAAAPSPPSYVGKAISARPPTWAAQPARPPVGGMGGSFGVLSPGMGRAARPGMGGGMGGGLQTASLGTSPSMSLSGTTTSPTAPTSVLSPTTTASPVSTGPTSVTGPQSPFGPSTSYGPPPATGPSTGMGPTDPWGYPTEPPSGPKKGRKGKKKYGGHNYARRLNRNAPPWLQDPAMFNQTTGTINDILGQRGHISPEKMIQEQASIEQGRGQAQDALSARLAQAGVDEFSPVYQSMAGTVDQTANRLQAENRRSEDIQSEQRMREDLNLVIPYLQAILGYTGKKGGGGVQAAPIGGGSGGGTDYAGLIAGMLGQGLQGWASSGFKTPGH